MEKIINNRYWVLRGTADLATGFFEPRNAIHLITAIDSISNDVPCMVLLAPPGMGKTTELKNAKQAAVEMGFETTFISLSTIYREEELAGSIGELSMSPNIPNFIFLDALDESPVTIPVIQSWLVKFVRKLKKDQDRLGNKIRFRLSSRTADWPEQFEKELESVLGDKSVQVFELAPLSKPQAIEYIESKTPNVALALNNLLDEQNGLMSRPVTLRMIANHSDSSNPILIDKPTIYRRGILALLEESNQTRRLSGKIGNLEVDARFVIAGRIAAASELSTKTVIWDGLHSDPIPEHAIPINELAGGVEPVLSDNINVNVKNIRETLKTGLFLPQDNNTYKWAHKTFAEFLAAYYIKEHSTSSESIFSLIRSNLPGNTNVVPQLREVAAWLSTFDKKVWDELVVDEPGLLLSSDITLQNDEEKRLLVEKLLQKLDLLETYDKHEWRPFYKRLSHKQLADQIKPIILDTTRNNVVRRTAIDIAEACDLKDLIEDLKNVAFDLADDQHIRAQATHALSLILPENRILELLPLAQNASRDDNDEIKGFALVALWPKYLTIEQLLEILQEPKRDSYIGSYAFFTYQLEFPDLTTPEAIAAIKWLKGQASSFDDSRSLSKLATSLLLKVWKSADDEVVMNELAAFAVEVTDSYHELRYELEIKSIQEVYSNDSPKKRRSFLHAIFKQVNESWTNPRLLLFTPWQIVTVGDLRWLIDDLISNQFTKSSNWYIELIISLISSWQYTFDLEYLFNVANEYPPLEKALSEVSVINLDSDLAKWKLEHAAKRKKNKSNAAIPSRKQTILDLLGKSKMGQLDAFWRLNLLLLEDSNNRVDESTGVLAPSPGWDELSSEEHLLVISEAKHYLYEFHLEDDFLQPNSKYRPALAGYRALRLLLENDFQSYKQIPSQIWSNWCLSIISFSSSDGETEREKYRQIARDCFTQIPEEFISSFSKYLSITGDAYHAVGLIKDWETEIFLKPLWDWFIETNLEETNESITFQFLLKSAYPSAIELAFSSLKSLEQNNDSETLRTRINHAATLVASQPKDTWPYLCRIINSNQSVARDLLMQLTRALSDLGFSTFPEDFQAQLYVWIHNLFERRPNTNKVRMLDAVDHTIDLKESILRRLINRGTSESVKAVKWIENQLPHIEWLRWSLADAKENQRRVEWTPFSPRDAIQQITATQFDLPIISDKDKLIDQSDDVDHNLLLEVGLIANLPEKIEIESEVPEEVATPFSLLTYLLVATEWSSAHGGVSTFNRNLCIALAKQGHTVYCFIPSAEERDYALASKHNVEIIVANNYPGLNIEAKLARGPIRSVIPDVVIGHDHITGSPALALARELYHCPYVHFIHTSPEDIEPHKIRSEESPNRVISHSKGNDKAEVQVSLCLESDIVLTVGPTLLQSIRTRLGDGKDKAQIMSILPGLNADLMAYDRTENDDYEMSCLITGRMADAVLKGGDLFIQIAGNFYTNPDLKALISTKFIMRGFDSTTMDSDLEKLKTFHGVKSPFLHGRPFIDDEVALLREIKSASLFIMPSKTEGFGLAGLEAIAAGIPSLISTQSGLGATIVNLAKGMGSDLKRIANECVIDTHPDGPDIALNWSLECSHRLNDLDKAFKDANDLRKELGKKLTWEAAALDVTEASILAKNNMGK